MVLCLSSCLSLATRPQPRSSYCNRRARARGGCMCFARTLSRCFCPRTRRSRVRFAYIRRMSVSLLRPSALIASNLVSCFAAPHTTTHWNHTSTGNYDADNCELEFPVERINQLMLTTKNTEFVVAHTPAGAVSGGVPSHEQVCSSL